MVVFLCLLVHAFWKENPRDRSSLVRGKCRYLFTFSTFFSRLQYNDLYNTHNLQPQWTSQMLNEACLPQHWTSYRQLRKSMELPTDRLQQHLARSSMSVIGSSTRSMNVIAIGTITTWILGKYINEGEPDG